MAANSHRVDFELVYIFAAKVHVSLEAEPSHQVVHPVQAPQHRALAAPGRPDEGRDRAALEWESWLSRTALKFTVEQFFDVAVNNDALAVTGRRRKVFGRLQ